MTERRPRSPSQSYNFGIEAAVREVAGAIDAADDLPTESRVRLLIDVVNRTNGIKRRTWHRQERAAVGEGAQRK